MRAAQAKSGPGTSAGPLRAWLLPRSWKKAHAMQFKQTATSRNSYGHRSRFTGETQGPYCSILRLIMRSMAASFAATSSLFT